MNEVDSTIESLDKDKAMYLKNYFKNAPDSVKRSVTVKRMPKEKVFINEGEKVNKIFVLLTGKVLAMDYRIYGMVYGYLQFEPIEVFGAMELLMGEDKYRTSLIATEDSLCFVIPRKEYELWLRNDLGVFSMQTEKIIRYLVEEARWERLYVLLSATERVCVFLCKQYQMYEKAGTYVVTMSRRRFADSVGISERTYTRIIADMQGKGMVKKMGRNIVVTQKQYEEMKKLVECKIHGMI
ncbi:MAG: Crp/Fnr family transcriptional regulator [Lachnospiraceae bacterium]|nr:Crp/Fnr family transcriptional regulator [Lachnospiraceae bacterium]